MTKYHKGGIIYMADIENWITAKGNHIPIKDGETPEQAFERFKKSVEKYSDEPDKDLQNAYIPKSNGIVVLPKKEYAQMCSAIRTRYANKIPSKGGMLLDDYCYLFTYNKKEMQILCVGKMQIAGNEDKIKEWEK